MYSRSEHFAYIMFLCFYISFDLKAGVCLYWLFFFFLSALGTRATFYTFSCFVLGCSSVFSLAWRVKVSSITRLNALTHTPIHTHINTQRQYITHKVTCGGGVWDCEMCRVYWCCVVVWSHYHLVASGIFKLKIKNIFSFVFFRLIWLLRGALRLSFLTSLMMLTLLMR